MASDTNTILSEMRVLYVEDSEDVRLFASHAIKRRVKELYTGEDGEIGEKLFFEHRPDIVVTDITMPNKDGLEMARAIKNASPQTPIIVATAHNEEDRFLTAIEIGVDRYIIKPIDIKQLLAALEHLAVIIKNRKLAEEYQKKLLQEQINSAAASMMSKLIDSSPNPEIVYKNDKVFYVNDAFMNLLDEEHSALIIKENMPLDVIFLKKDGFLSSLESLDAERHANNKVTIKIGGGRKIYYVIKREIPCFDGEKYTIYTLNDITLYEYQKLKVKQYSEMLQELIFKSPNKGSSKTKEEMSVASITKSPEPEEQKSSTSFEPDTSVTATPKLGSKQEKESLIISAEQANILRRAHKNRVSANEYIEEIGEAMLDDLDELRDIEEEIKSLSEDFGSKRDAEILDEVTKRLDRISAIINLFFEFQDLSYAIRHLSNVLREAKEAPIDDKKREMLKLYITSVTEEIGQWRQTIFVTKEAVDIHYLDASLFGSCLQIELVLQDKKLEAQDGEDDDLLLF